MKFRLFAVLATLAVIALTACGVAAVHDEQTAPPPPSVTGPAVLPPRIAGVVTENLSAFDSVCGCRPDLAVHYVRWGENLATSQTLAAGMLADGASPLLEIEPYGVSLAGIAAGRDDAWLLSYAAMVRSLKSQVMLSFAPEANGNWYSWGYPKSTPAQFVAAWRHVVTLFRQAGAVNSRWAWLMNFSYPGSTPLAELWPGGAYVNTAGIDGYFTAPSVTFAARFGPTIAAVRKLTAGPLLIGETGAAAATLKASAIGQVTAGVRAYGLAGFILFDIDQQNGRDPAAPAVNRNDWSIDNDPAALAEFKAEVKE